MTWLTEDNYYFQIPYKAKKFQGNQRTTLPTVIDMDLKAANQIDHTIPVKQFRTSQDLSKLTDIAQDRDEWRKLVDTICFAYDK